MRKRAAVKVTVGVIVLLVLSISTAGARQLWNENQAQSSFTSARAAANGEIARALSAGVVAEHLTAYRARLNQLGLAKAPSSSLWSSSRASFYDRQANVYRAISVAVHTKIRDDTRAARLQAQQQLLKYDSVIARAKLIDLNTSTARSSLKAEMAQLRMSATPRQYRSVWEASGTSLKPLMAEVVAKEQYVHTLVKVAGNQRSGVIGRASQEISGAQGELSLLGLLTPRAGSYRTTFNNDLQKVQRAPTTMAAAVNESRLHDDLAALSADYNKTVPYKMIVVSTESQSAVMYQAGQEVNSTPVTTGGPELPTDHGVFHIYLEASPFTFHSPWPPGSPYYYNPTPIQYWMPFDGGEGLHDASWRSNFGPGSNVAPTDLGTGNTILGTHGCVNMPLAAAAFTYSWAPIGTTVIVI